MSLAARPGILLVLLSLAAPLGGAETAPAPGESAALTPTSIFRIEIDGSEVRTAETYAGDPGLLILGCNLKGPILVAKVDQTVRYIPEEGLVRDGEGNVTLKGAPSGPICTYQVSAGQIIFQAEGRKVRVSPKPPLIGPQTLEAIIEHSPDYGSRINLYRPEGVAVAYLSKYSRDTEVNIYFGSWCSVCEAWVPRLVKSLQAAGNSHFQTRFVALPRNFLSDVMARQRKIQGVPTIILIQEGREIGRLEGRPELGTIEESLVKMLRTAGGG